MKAMQEQGTQTVSRGVRALNLAVAAVLVAGGAWAAHRFGPKPSGAKHGEGEVARKAPAPAAAPTVQAADRQAELGLPNFGMFDAGRTRVGGGVADGTPEEFLAAAERKYIERGFHPAPIGREAALAPKAPGASSGKLYYRADCPIPMLLAFGRGADPTGDGGSGEPGAYMTVCAPSRDGRTEWATFRYNTDDRALAESLERFRSGDPNADFPGEDPAGVPRAPGSRRLLSVTRPLPAGKGVVALYQIEAPIDEVRRYYTEEMALRAWRLDTFSTNQAAAFGRGVLCYTQGQRLCTLWIDQKTPGDKVVHVFVSSR